MVKKIVQARPYFHGTKLNSFLFHQLTTETNTRRECRKGKKYLLIGKHYGKRTRRRRPDYMLTAKCRGRRRTTRARAAAIPAVGVHIPVGVDMHTPTAAVGVPKAVGVQTPAVTERRRPSRYRRPCRRRTFKFRRRRPPSAYCFFQLL